jgi:hypothetical protein
LGETTAGETTYSGWCTAEPQSWAPLVARGTVSLQGKSGLYCAEPQRNLLPCGLVASQVSRVSWRSVRLPLPRADGSEFCGSAVHQPLDRCCATCVVKWLFCTRTGIERLKDPRSWAQFVRRVSRTRQSYSSLVGIRRAQEGRRAQNREVSSSTHHAPLHTARSTNTSAPPPCRAPLARILPNKLLAACGAAHAPLCGSGLPHSA